MLLVVSERWKATFEVINCVPVSLASRNCCWEETVKMTNEITTKLWQRQQHSGLGFMDITLYMWPKDPHHYLVIEAAQVKRYQMASGQILRNSQSKFIRLPRLPSPRQYLNSYISRTTEDFWNFFLKFWESWATFGVKNVLAKNFPFGAFSHEPAQLCIMY